MPIPLYKNVRVSNTQQVRAQPCHIRAAPKQAMFLQPGMEAHDMDQMPSRVRLIERMEHFLQIHGANLTPSPGNRSLCLENGRIEITLTSLWISLLVYIIQFFQSKSRTSTCNERFGFIQMNPFSINTQEERVVVAWIDADQSFRLINILERGQRIGPVPGAIGACSTAIGQDSRAHSRRYRRGRLAHESICSIEIVKSTAQISIPILARVRPTIKSRKAPQIERLYEKGRVLRIILLSLICQSQSLLQIGQSRLHVSLVATGIAGRQQIVAQ